MAGKSPRLIDGGRSLAGGPHDRLGVVRRNALGVGADDSIGAVDQPRREDKLDAAAAEVALGVPGESWVQPGEQRLLRLDEDPAEIPDGEVRIPLHGISRQALDFRQGFNAGVSSSDEREREEFAATPRIPNTLGRVDLVEHPIAKPDGIGQRLEADGVFDEPGDREDRRYRARRQQRYLERDLVTVPF